LDFVQKFSEITTLEKLETAIDMLEKTHYSVERNANPKILFLDLSLQLVYYLNTIRSLRGLNIYN
jgi:DNA polymerase-3 subunit delta'